MWREVTNSNGLQGHMQGAGVGFELAVGPEFIHLPDRRNTIVLAVHGVMISSPTSMLLAGQRYLLGYWYSCSLHRCPMWFLGWRKAQAIWYHGERCEEGVEKSSSSKKRRFS